MALVAASILAYCLLVCPMRLQYTQLSRQRAAAKSRCDDLRKVTQENHAYISCFSRQTNFRQHVLRERLGYAETDEVIYIFEDNYEQPRKK
ncbi:MAG: hypothetical protein LBI69_03365 [Puniceicoccales bacterium]|nr:hypothetical protein [Puniceicoccales bacterium]